MSSSTPREFRLFTKARFAGYLAPIFRRKPRYNGARQGPEVPYLPPSLVQGNLNQSPLLSSPIVDAPIEKLATELLCEIFLYVCFGNVDPSYAPCIEANPKSGPQLLSQVCGLWLDIVLGMPLLWAAIHIRTTTTLRLVELWIERSRSLPFSFFLDFDKPEGGPDFFLYGPVDPYIFLLSSVMNRWESVSVFRSETYHCEASRGMNYQLWKHWIPSTLPLPSSQQLLESLVSGGRIVWKSEKLGVPTERFLFWRQVTYIDIGNSISLSQCITILRNCIHTVDAKFACVSPTNMNSGTQITSVVRSLRKLTIETPTFDISLLLDFITCPQLQSLRFGAIGWCPLSHNRIHTFVKRSACALQEVMIIDSRLKLSVIECFDDPLLHKFPTFFVCPGPVTQDQREVIFSALKARQSDEDIIVKEISVPNPGSRRSCHWFGWVRRPEEVQQPR